jgi:hypothetical protein
MSAILSPAEKQARQARRASSSTPVAPAPPPDQQTATHHLAAANETNRLLTAILSRENLDLRQITVTDGSRRIRRIRDWPIPGASRYVLATPGNGYAIGVQASAAAVALVCGERPSRLGGRISNSPAADVILFLTAYENVGTVPMVPMMYLPAGQSWDFKVSDTVWGGHVCAMTPASVATAAELYLAEI